MQLSMLGAREGGSGKWWGFTQLVGPMGQDFDRRFFLSGL